MSAYLLRYFRPARKELKQLLIIALPIVVAQLAQTAMGFVDTVMAGRLSAEALAAVAIGSGVWLPIFLSLGGVLMALTPIVAKLSRHDDNTRLVRFFQQTLWLGVVFSFFSWFVIRHCHGLLELLQVPDTLKATVLDYLAAVSWGMPAAILYQACRAFHEGLAKTYIPMTVGVIGLALNVPANYVFIYGKLGLPAFGAIGCAWGTVFVFWSMAVVMCFITAYIVVKHHFPFLGERCRFHLGMTLQLLKIGLPIGGTLFVEVSIFCAIALLVAQLGTTVVAAQQIALNLSGLFFMVPLSFSMAMTIHIGQALGHHEIELARFRCGCGLAFITLLMLVSMSIMLLYRQWLVGFYTHDADVALLAGQLMYFAAIFQLSDGLQIGAAGALRGYQDTGVTLGIMLFTFWGVALSLGYYLTYVGDFGPAGFWIGLLVGLTLTAVLLSWRLWVVSRAPKPVV